MYFSGFVVLAVVTAVALMVRWLLRRSGRLPTVHRWLKLTALLVMHLGALLMVWAVADLGLVVEAGSWPSVTGYIVTAEIGGGKNYRPEVRYRYTVDGLEYTTLSTMQAPGFGGKRKRYDVAKGLVGSWRPGDSIAVYYRPSQPAESTLTLSPRWDLFVRGATGLVLFGGCLFVALLPRKVQPQRL